MERPDTSLTEEVLRAVVARTCPEVLEAIDRAHTSAWQAVDPVLLELCRLRIARLLGSEEEETWRTPAAVSAGLDEATVDALASWPTSDRFGPRERACLGFTEQFVLDVSSVADGQAAAVADELGDDGLADFANALLVVEQRIRMSMAWQRVLR